MRARGEAGFTNVPVAGVSLLSLMLLIAVSSMMMARAAETWRSQIRREQELDLIRYGQEYKKGIEEFFQANNRYPSSLEELCEPPDTFPFRRYMRRCYLDPITGEEFRLIGPGEIGKRAAERQQQELQEDDEELYGGFARRNRRGDEDEPREGPRVSDIEYGLPGRASEIEWSDERPFVGVASSSEERPFRRIDEATAYDEWEFVAQVRVGGRPGAAGGAAGAGGTSGAGQQGSAGGRRSGAQPGAPGGFGQQGASGGAQPGARPRLDRPQVQPQQR